MKTQGILSPSVFNHGVTNSADREEEEVEEQAVP